MQSPPTSLRHLQKRTRATNSLISPISVIFLADREFDISLKSASKLKSKQAINSEWTLGFSPFRPTHAFSVTIYIVLFSILALEQILHPVKI